jgi:hypothetical protein
MPPPLYSTDQSAAIHRSCGCPCAKPSAPWRGLLRPFASSDRPPPPGGTSPTDIGSLPGAEQHRTVCRAVRCVSLDTSSRRVHPSPLSSSPLRPAPPVSARHPHPTALQGAGLLPELLLAALSQTAGFEVLGRPGRAPGTTPVPTLLPRLGVTFHDSVTSLRGSYPRALHRTRWAPTQLQSPRTVVPSSLSGGRTQKLLPYPSVQVLRCSASSLNRVTSKGFLPLS